jgi:hypothetical protein
MPGVFPQRVASVLVQRFFDRRDTATYIPTWSLSRKRRKRFFD